MAECSARAGPSCRLSVRFTCTLSDWNQLHEPICTQEYQSAYAFAAQKIPSTLWFQEESFPNCNLILSRGNGMVPFYPKEDKHPPINVPPTNMEIPQTFSFAQNNCYDPFDKRVCTVVLSEKGRPYFHMQTRGLTLIPRLLDLNGRHLLLSHPRNLQTIRLLGLKHLHIQGLGPLGGTSLKLTTCK